VNVSLRLGVFVAIAAAACTRAPASAIPSKTAAYPATYDYYGGRAAQARADAIATELGVDVADLEIDPLGCARSVLFRTPVRSPRIDDVAAWSRFFDGHRAAFCIAPGAKLRIDQVPPGDLELRDDGDQRMVVSKEADGIRLWGRMWAPPVLPAARVTLASVATDLVGRPFMLHARAHAPVPMCQGCPAQPPDVDLGTVDATTELADFEDVGPLVQLGCGSDATLELRRVLVIVFRPKPGRRFQRQSRDKLDSLYDYRIQAGAVGGDKAFESRVVDAVTGEPLAGEGWSFLESPPRDDMCN